MTDHQIIKGTEKYGLCGKCGLGGDLTMFSCQQYQKIRKQVKEKVAKMK